MSDDSRMDILQQIETGKLTAAEALDLLNAQALPVGAEAASTGEVGALRKLSPSLEPQIRYWQRWWLIPMFAGVGLILLGSLWMAEALRAAGMGFWFFFAGLPFGLGVVIAALAWNCRKSRWVHVRADLGGSTRPRIFAFSLPIPVGLAAWGLRIFGQRFSGLAHTAVDDLLIALDEVGTPDAPIFIEVNQGEKGERVQVYVG